MPRYDLLCISGALRRGSTNTRLLAEAARLFEPASITWGDLRLPLYDGDLEDAEGIPQKVQTLADQIASADAVMISTPEYNQNLSGVLKNALDWVSRTKGGPWRDKPVAIMSAAAGRAGGARAQYSLRHAMTPFGPRILQGPDVMIADARNAFDEHGRLMDQRSVDGLQKLVDRLKTEVQRDATKN